MALMDWYFESGNEDLVVPSGQELSDRLPSPESWSQWGLCVPENFKLPNKSSVIDPNLTREELNFNGETCCNDVEMGSSKRNEDQSSGLSVDGGLWEEFIQQSSLWGEQPDHQLDGLAGTEPLDDLILSSMLEDLPGTENICKSFCFPPESESGMVPTDNLYLTDNISDLQCMSNVTDITECSKYCKTHAFSPLLDSEEIDVPASQFILSEQKDWPIGKVPLVKISFPLEHNSKSGCVDEETSLEESVLQELEVATTQFSDKDRICFRDALYRLAANSVQHTTVRGQNGDVTTETPPWTAQEEKMRPERKGMMEPETNTIDRAIANLMFNRMELNLGDFPASKSVTYARHVCNWTKE